MGKVTSTTDKHRPKWFGVVVRYSGGPGTNVILTKAEYEKAYKRYLRELKAFHKRKAKYEAKESRRKR
jgi:hypothetical protein